MAEAVSGNKSNRSNSSDSTDASSNASNAGKDNNVNGNYNNSNNAVNKTENIMTSGIATLMLFMMTFETIAQNNYEKMSQKTVRGRESQQKANAIDALIASFKNANDKGAVPVNVYEYMMENNIFLKINKPSTHFGNNGGMDSLNIRQFLWDKLYEKGYNTKQIEDIEAKGLSAFLNEDVVKLFKGDLDQIKSTLETDANKCTDFVSQAQLQVQKTIQSYNVCVGMINSMQTLLAEMNKSIAQNIR